MIEKVSDLSEQVLYEFLSYCMSPFPERITKECYNYRTNKDRELYGIYIDEIVRGIMGLNRSDSETELMHIAIHPDFRIQGLGSKLIKYVIEFATIDRLIAETDRDAVNFYKKMGFTITSLGEKYPGVERFKCEYMSPSSAI